MTNHGRKAPRSISIENLLIWTYRDQRAGDDFAGLHESELQADGFLWAGMSGDGVATLMDRARLGCRIDGGGFSGTATPRLHPDAEVTDAWVRALGEERARVLIRFAAAAMRPPLPEEPRLEPLRWGADDMGESEPVPKKLLGPPSLWVRDRRGRFVQTEGHVGDGRLRVRRIGGGVYEAYIRWTPICWRPSPEHVRALRLGYERWRADLLGLGEILREGGGLRDHSVTEETPPAPTWAPTDPV